MTVASPEEVARESAERFVQRFDMIRTEVGKFIVGQHRLVEDVLLAIVCGGHVLLEGVPGLGKTALVHSFSEALDLKFQRIQFTPDLLPADIVGTQVLVDREGHKRLEFAPGPVFCNLLLADEINRATPKTQSALLETMQEHSVTVAGQTHKLGSPFFVLATQNPIEQDGTYPLPEAQLDRFFFKLLVASPSHDDYAEILNRTGGNHRPTVSPVVSGEDILEMGATLRETPIDETVRDYLIRVVRATHPENEEAPEAVKRFVRHGASPRGAQAMLAASRARALLAGRFHVSRDDVAEVAVPALRHRIILGFEGEADGVRTDRVIRDVLEALG
ncbi:ATPase family associated with various cellular activities (AAA) [Pseudobythopirellula maris]|uniref:ATPase family associated with various cellular activities (AAA) n=1 Tax=Pseudobythopirellula maris TaxID=2527991 RepID=A0A5C5ZRQ5_9BACT|nr:MoxR family ATPase [Pseudobythopirellula maris]TWT90194.1 ATPase family associated with various cellular activities (AAA) [Pseudobythopirellula maris]